jgi:putative ABC transport system permease protein
MHLVSVDEDFLDVFSVELLAGRNFSKEMASDATEAFLLNEAAVRALGWSDPIGKRFAWGDKDGRVIGVVKDFHTSSLREKIAPTFFCKDRLYSLALKIRPQNIPETMRYIKEKTVALRPHRGFEFSFLDQALDQRYRAEMQLGAIGQIFATLAVFLACLGLFGLIAFAIQQRTKEVGVRKVLGASVFNIVSLLTWDVLKLVLIANLFAWPAAYMAMDRWLDNFAYRIDLSAVMFLAGSVLTLTVALATVGSQAFKAARTKPADALRCE